MATNTGLRHEVLLLSQSGIPLGNLTWSFDQSIAAVAFTADSGSSCPCSGAHRTTFSLSPSFISRHAAGNTATHLLPELTIDYFPTFIKKAITRPIIFV